jgi:hypothetical protein
MFRGSEELSANTSRAGAPEAAPICAATLSPGALVRGYLDGKLLDSRRRISGKAFSAHDRS